MAKWPVMDVANMGTQSFYSMPASSRRVHQEKSHAKKTMKHLGSSAGPPIWEVRHGFSMWFLVFLSRLVPKHGRPVTQKEGVAQVSVDVSAPSGDGQEIQALKVGTPIGEAREVTVQVNSLVFYFRGCYRCRAVCAVMQVAAGIGFFERSADNPRNLPPLHRKE